MQRLTITSEDRKLEIARRRLKIEDRREHEVKVSRARMRASKCWWALGHASAGRDGLTDGDVFRIQRAQAKRQRKAALR